MSFAMRGMTHCEECGTSLDMNEWGRCRWCEEKYQKRQEEIKFNEAVEQRVEIELAKITKNIETIKIKNINSNKVKTYKGYWEDSIFNVIDE